MQAVRDGLSGMRMQKCINRGIQMLVGTGGEVAPQSGGDQILVDGVLFQRG